MSTWDALKKQLLSEHSLMRADGASILVACRLPSGRWFVELAPKGEGGEASLEISILVGRAEEISKAALAAATESVVLGRLVVVRGFLVVETALPLAGLELPRLRSTIAALAWQAARASSIARPHVALRALFEHLAE